MKKIFALLLAMAMVFALCACGGGSDDAAATTETTEAAEPAAAEAAAPADAADDLDGYKAYVIAYAEAGAPTEDEAQAVADKINACTTAEEIEATSELTILYQNAGVLTYAEWIAAGSPAADASAMERGDPNAGAGSGEASGEPTGEPPAEPAA